VFFYVTQELKVMTARICLWISLLIPLFLSVTLNDAQACFACWAGYGPGAERLNKPLADLRIIYEAKGRDSLPYIRQALTTSTDPLVIKRSAGYIVELNDKESIPYLEDVLSQLVKRVAFSSFGIGTPDYQGRLAVAHALAKLNPPSMADQIWQKYDKLDLNRKSEVPYILNALEDPQLTRRLLIILNREDDHQMMVGALNVLAVGGSPAALPVLREKVNQWEVNVNKPVDTSNPGKPILYYSVLEIKAKRALAEIEERCK
jgi:hypothetical protein